MSLGLLDVVNASALRFRLVDSLHGQAIDEFWLTKSLTSVLEEGLGFRV